jgi:hypothetical protein
VTQGGLLEIEYELEVRRPPDVVFDLLADTASMKLVDRALVEVAPEGPLEAGAAGRFIHRRGGMTARTTWRVTEFARPNLLEVAIQGAGYEMTERASLEAIGAGTRATFVDRVWPTSLGGRVMVALSRWIMTRDLRARSARLKTVLEGGSPQK